MLRILLIRLDFLGDMVCTTALIRSLKRKWPTAEIHVLANKYNSYALDGNPDVEKVHRYVYSKKRERNNRSGLISSIIDKFLLIMRLKRLNFDLLIIPNGGMNKNSIQFARFINIPDSRWHTAETEFDDRKAEHIANRPIKHEVLAGHDLVPELGVTNTDDLRLYVYPDPELQKKWSSKLENNGKPNIGFFISNKTHERRWPWDHWHSLAKSLGCDFNIIIFSNPGEEPKQDSLNGITAQCADTETVPELIAAMSQLDLVVSADSAPVHIGAALQIPIVGLFEARPEKYLRWYPIGVKHVLLYSGKCIDSISVAEVKDAVISLIS
ncbi:glycosyltransferase family 9 protein [Pectobacterium polaris]|uniref:glycosyltransferase family 9 protein n=1 Tax=Pectobacterium polaris TaxID=2042057 RepID=UPI000EA02E01|nr:glycosyltransferase family 9 protein [Pectobacterium polaris]MDE8743313.1 glycosyltransferase family 9 protein [Pectobacterium polaris]MDE8753737.1 glycosyltransferase family 9 protein [Pectobacterium polaris]MDE8757522.1 glycosyltransferase family 9 protein [Pectobacterium polaris]RJL19818.1 lipopolysaccharide heptosyltransferase family protein [Pectobacterium polaris]